MQMEITRNAQSPDAASRKIKSRVWLLPLAELQKANSFLVEKVASGRDVTLAPWTGEWHDTPEPPLAAASQPV
jgi:hypothetical protein